MQNTPIKDSKVIVLWGKGSRGKTTTLNLLIQELLSSGAALLYGKQATSLLQNCWVILEYHGRKIGIITAGDDEKTLNYYFLQLCIQCDIYICAARSKGSSCRYIESRFFGHVIMWQEKWSITEWSGTTKVLTILQNDANKKQALGLIDAINIL